MATEVDKQQQALELLMGKFPKRYAVKTTQYLLGLMKALAVGDGYISTQVEAVRDNLIAVTATGQYLDRAAGRYGIVRGQGTGVLDADFQKLIPILGNSPKQITHILLKIIDTIYGPYASHANITAGISEPYELHPGCSIKVRVDDTIQEVVFGPEDAVDLAAAKADELATAISRKTRGKIVGSTILEARTGKRFLNLRTSTIGSQGFIQILGGDAQSRFQFPQTRTTTPSIATWDVLRYAGTDEMVYSVVGGVGPDLKAAGVTRGDLCTIREDSGLDGDNTGTFEVTFVGSGFFRVKNGNGIPQSGIVQVHGDDFVFYKPDIGNILLSSRPAAIIETAPRELTVILPVTSPIVKRTLMGGHHFHQGLTTVTATTSNSIELASPTGFEPTGAAFPVLSRKLSKAIISSASGTSAILINAQNWPSKGSFWSANTRQFYYYSGRSANTLTGISPTPDAKLSGATIEYVERYRYASISGNTLLGVYPDPTGIVNQEIVACGAIIDPNFPGSYVFDPKATFIAAQDATTIGETIRQGSVKTVVKVSDVSSWPEKGYFTLEFGTAAQEGPIRYLGKVGKTALIVDPGHVYERDHLDGSGTRLVRQLGPYTPRADGTDLAVYITSTSPARDLLAQYLRLIAASGVKLRFVIRMPDQKWPYLPNLFTTLPTDTELVTI